MAVTELFPYLGICGIAALCLLDGRQAERFKQEYAELARGIEVKRLSGRAEDQALAGVDALGEHLAEVMQGLRVDEDAVVLHMRQHRAQRQLDILEQRLHALLAQALAELLRQAVDAGRPDGKDAFRLERGLVRRRDVQIVLRQLRQGVGPARRIEQIGRHSRVEHDPRRLHAESQQRTQQRLAVVHGLRHVRRKQALQQRHEVRSERFAAQHIGRLVRAVHVRRGHEHREIVCGSNAERHA